MDPLSSLGNAVSLVTRLREISKNMANAEFANALADLMNELADAKMQVVDLKTRLVAQSEEIAALKSAAEGRREKPRLKWGCYVFDDDEERLYCTACYDSRGAKSLTNRVNAKYRRCPVCSAVIGAH